MPGCHRTDPRLIVFPRLGLADGYSMILLGDIYIYSCIHPICISPAIFTTTGPCFCPGDWSFIPVVRLQEHQSIAIQHLKFHRCELNPGLSFIPWFKICDSLYIFSIQVIIPNGVWTQFYKVRFQF